MSELTKRILFAVPAAALFLYITWVGSFYFAGLVILIALFIQRELSMIIEKAGFKPDDFFPYTIGLWILLAPFLPHAKVLGIIIFLLFMLIQIFKTSGVAVKELVSTFFCGIYVPVGFLTLIMIRNTSSTETGFVLTVALLLMVWGNDIFAYFGGKSFGKHALAPEISPNKTWEGFVSGIAGALVGLLIAVYALPFEFPISLAAISPVVLLISIFGPVGDLMASRLKRAAGVKDASNLLPGHGGLFDRFDALVLASPAFYCYLYLMKIFGYATF